MHLVKWSGGHNAGSYDLMAILQNNWLSNASAEQVSYLCNVRVLIYTCIFSVHAHNTNIEYHVNVNKDLYNISFHIYVRIRVCMEICRYIIIILLNSNTEILNIFMILLLCIYQQYTWRHAHVHKHRAFCHYAAFSLMPLSILYAIHSQWPCYGWIYWYRIHIIY